MRPIWTRRAVLRAASLTAVATPLFSAPGKTTVEIRGDAFWVNGKPTYPGRTYQGMKIEGLLMNSRMIQGIFDDENPETVARWKYPDTGKWDPERNTREFLAAMPEWRRHGLIGFTIGLQGGSPEGYSKAQPWRNSAFAEDGSLKPAYMARLKRILDRADELGMVPIINYFYFGQDEHIRPAAIPAAAENATKWLLEQGYRNVIVDLVNECDNRAYDQEALKAANIHTLIDHVRSIRVNGRSLAVGTSFNGGRLPTHAVVRASDFILLHGNGVSNPLRIAEMVEIVRHMPDYRPMPILFNEDDHFDFDKPVNNMMQAVSRYAGWGYFDPGKNDYNDGYQSVPTRWDLNNERKKAFFALLKEVTGG